MNISYIAMWVITIVALLALSRYRPMYSIALALGLALFYAVKYFKSKKK